MKQVPKLVNLLQAVLSSSEQDVTALINLLAALTAVAQQGVEGAKAVVDAKGV